MPAFYRDPSFEFMDSTRSADGDEPSPTPSIAETITVATWSSCSHFTAADLVRIYGQHGADDGTKLPATQATQTFVAIAHLLELEKRGYSAALISSRRRLRDLDPEMFAFYMARRDVHHR